MLCIIGASIVPEECYARNNVTIWRIEVVNPSHRRVSGCHEGGSGVKAWLTTEILTLRVRMTNKGAGVTGGDYGGLT